MSYGKIVEGIIQLFVVMALLLIIFLPLGVWKLIETIIWVYQNVNITIN